MMIGGNDFDESMQHVRLDVEGEYSPDEFSRRERFRDVLLARPSAPTGGRRTRGRVTLEMMPHREIHGFR